MESGAVVQPHAGGFRRGRAPAAPNREARAGVWLREAKSPDPDHLNALADFYYATSQTLAKISRRRRLNLVTTGPRRAHGYAPRHLSSRGTIA
jgi:hypothetical protein